jgi:hypothetical protein
MKNYSKNPLSQIANLLVDGSVQRMAEAGVLVGDDNIPGLLGEEQFGVLSALHWLREQLFQIIPLEQLANIKTYSTPSGILMHISGVSARDSPGFDALFQPLPDCKLKVCYLEIGDSIPSFIGEWDLQTDSYPWEDSVDLRLGPDGQVWARVGTLEQIPVSPD